MNLIEAETKIEDPNYEKFYDKDDLQLYSKKKGTIFNQDIPSIKSVLKLKKNYFKEGTDIRILDYFMNEQNIRKKWDKSITDYKIVESTEWSNAASYIVHYVTTKPTFFVSERDCLDKRYDLLSNGIFYDFSSSVDDNVNIIILYCSIFKLQEMLLEFVTILVLLKCMKKEILLYLFQ